MLGGVCCWEGAAVNVSAYVVLKLLLLVGVSGVCLGGSYYTKVYVVVSHTDVVPVVFAGPAGQIWPDLMSESAKELSTRAAARIHSTSDKPDSDLCWKNVIKINLEARQQVIGLVLLSHPPGDWCGHVGQAQTPRDGCGASNS